MNSYDHVEHLIFKLIKNLTLEDLNITIFKSLHQILLVNFNLK